MHPRINEEYPFSRFWTYDKDGWDPHWWNKIGVPYFGADEWGRRTIIIGFGFLGYVVWAYRTCWCRHCHESRYQTYGDMKVTEHQLTWADRDY